jgi:hypothetical protein
LEYLEVQIVSRKSIALGAVAERQRAVWGLGLPPTADRPLVLGASLGETAPAFAPSLIAELDQLLRRVSHLSAVVAAREADEIRARALRLLLGFGTGLMAEDDYGPPSVTAEAKVAIPSSPERSLPRETRAGPASGSHQHSSDDDEHRSGPPTPFWESHDDR